MTAQHDDANSTPAPATENVDPIGPITPPKRGKLGSRALALVGTASLAALTAHSVLDGVSTNTTINEG